MTRRIVRAHAASCLGVPLAACLLLPVLARAASAQDHDVGFDAGTIVPVNSKDIQLVREAVDLDCPLAEDDVPARAFCRYVLGNLSSSERTFTMTYLAGLPSGLDGTAPETPPMRVEIDGHPARFHLEKTNRKRWSKWNIALPDSLPIWEVTIPGRGSAHVEIEYEIRWSATTEDKVERREIRYFARPGALWSGKVSESAIRLHFGRVTTALLRAVPADQERPVGLSFEPDDAAWTGTGLVWQRSNRDPNHDFRFVVDWEYPVEEE